MIERVVGGAGPRRQRALRAGRPRTHPRNCNAARLFQLVRDPFDDRDRRGDGESRCQGARPRGSVRKR